MKALVATLLLFACPCLADTVVPTGAVGSHVNLRAAPAADAEIVGRLSKGEALEHLGSQEGWHHVRIGPDLTGYVSDAWTEVVAGENAPKADDAAPAAAADPAGDAKPSPAPEAADTRKPPSAAAAEDAPAAGEEATSATDATPAAEATAETTPATEEAPAAAEEATPAAEEPTAVAEATPAAEEATPVAIATPAAGDVTGGASETESPAEPPLVVDEVGRSTGRPVLRGSENYLVKFNKPEQGGNSQIYDDGNFVGIGTADPKQRLEVNGSIQIHEQHSPVAGLMITQSSGDTGYVLHNAASTLTIGAGSIDRITINKDGNVGFGVNRPVHPLEASNGAHLTAGGVWTNSSSRSRKEDIATLTAEDALNALVDLEPVRFRYVDDAEPYVGFIAEDVPELVASGDRESLSPMDIVAVLTKVVQEQQQRIEALEAELGKRR